MLKYPKIPSTAAENRGEYIAGANDRHPLSRRVGDDGGEENGRQ